MSLFINTLIIAIFVSFGIVHHVSDAAMIASTTLYGANNLGLFYGTINFTQDTSSSPVRISGSLRNLQQTQSNSFGFHVHVYGTLDNSCVAAGGHYNPTGVTHGAPWNSTRHVGDLGNINRTGDPTMIDFYDSTIKLTGPYSIIGRSLVLHQGTDDYGMNGTTADSAITGNAGARLACGIIGVVSDFNQQGSGTETLTNNFKTFALITLFVVVKNVFV